MKTRLDCLQLKYRAEMAMDRDYDKPEPTRDEVDRWPGPAVLEFGAGWCPHWVRKGLEAIAS
jgi:hypothetical protein